MMKIGWLWRMVLCLLVLACRFEAVLADDAYAETPIGGASDAQINNILLAVQAIDGVRMEFGEEFSFNEIVGERSAERGFEAAENGRGVKVIGGGVAQTATTLYLALTQRDDIEYSSIYTYNENFSASYVTSGYDAIATDYAAGLDFAFNSYHDGALVIYMWMDDDSLCCYVTEATDGMLGEGKRIARAELPSDPIGPQSENVRLAADAISGWTLRSGEIFSFNEIVGERSAERGYQAAENGRGVKTTGGGVAQTAAAIDQAVSGLESVQMLERQTYGADYAGSYVEDGDDAVLVDYHGGIDFSFVYQGKGEMSVWVYMNGNRLICEIYEK